MRRAKLNDYWRAIERYEGWKVRIDEVRYTDVTGIGTGSMKLSTPLNFICGPNGAGKTTLLRGIGATLAPSDARTSATTRFRLSSGRMSIAARSNHEAIVELNFEQMNEAEDWGDSVEIFHVDTSSVVSDLQNYFCQFPNIQDAINGVPIREATPHNLDTLRYLTNIRYAAARVYTLEETSSDAEPDGQGVDERPFFEVQIGEKAYDSRSMGLGELAAFYLWWSLERVSDKTILLIEEPESFLSPTCQTAFAAVLAQYTSIKRPFVVVTTHSPQIIQSAPKASLRFLFRDGVNSRVNEGDPIDVLLKTVGIERKARTLLMVEDNAARIFSRLWVRKFAPQGISGIEFIAMNGDGNILKALDAFSKSPASLSLIGLLDGDAEGKGVAGERILFLPGGKPIETIYREMVETEIERVEPILGIDNLRQILSGLQGLELHEWFEAFRKESNLTNDQLHLVLFRAWVAKPDNLELATRYFSQLEEIADIF